ncbi:roadblock/LC7 domain-containing protein [Sphaerisporangium perillae]|uniref:roadblock/LC7 domain-containing protein n=1 Tax=Sphaerisporangium perillae TaxID=2935860 RepID=UPI00200EA376|nr:roadblock/LC7 domain-containing protein [Sphaerisporangium perillae]
MDLRHDLHEEMLLLMRRMADVTGALVCTVDGMPVTADVRVGAEQASALSSALLAMSRRMTELAQAGALEETLVSGVGGYAACYAAGPKLVLTVFAARGTNLGLLRIEGRKTAANLAAIVERAPAADQASPARP